MVSIVSFSQRPREERLRLFLRCTRSVELPPYALFRFDHKGWYDRKGLTFQEVVDVGMVAAMGPPGGGRNEISARLLRHYCVLAYDELQRASIATIFQTLNRHCFQQFPPDIQVSHAHYLRRWSTTPVLFVASYLFVFWGNCRPSHDW